MSVSARKTLLVVFITVVALFSATYVFSSNNSTQTSELKVFTIKELAAFDGQEGRQAYVAVDGKVYNVTKVKAWFKGQHKGYKAGKDLTKVITMSPHGKAVLAVLPVVGTLKPEKEDK